MTPISFGSPQRILLAGVAVVLVVVLPLLNTLAPESIFYLPDFYLQLFGKYLSLSILALGLCLLWGFAGILSLGQAVFFGLGGYSMGMYLMLEISTAESKYGEAIPDFMVWNQVKELPLFWEPFHSFGLTIAAIILVPTLFAIIFGYLTFRRGIRGVYIAILTQAMAYAAWLLFNRNEMKLGGTNGLTDFKRILGFSLQEASTQRGLYIITALCLMVAFFLCHRIISSKLGKVLCAIRDNEKRVLFSGYSPTGFKVFAFVVSAFLGGLSGALYVPQVGIITPSQIGVLPSLEVVVWVALGGREYLAGGPLGAVVVSGLRTILTSKYPELWPFILGGLFVTAVLVFPAGLMGLPAQIRRQIRKHRAPEGSEPSPMPAHSHTTPAQLRHPERPAGPGANDYSTPATTQNPGTNTILYVEGVTVSFEGFLALQNLNFTMREGELRFVIGPNGAGKTTLLDVVCGRVSPVQGRVLFRDTDLMTLREHQIANAGIGRKFQTPSVFPRHTVYDNLLLTLKSDKKVMSTLFKGTVENQKEKIMAVLEKIGLIHQGQQLAGSLSHGQKQWLEIGMLIAQDPQLLLLDEPVAGMTGREREETGRLLLEISREHSVLVIEHDMEFVRNLAQTVTVLHEGSVLCEGPMEEVRNDPRVIEVYLGREQETHA